MKSKVNPNIMKIHFIKWGMPPEFIEGPFKSSFSYIYYFYLGSNLIKALKECKHRMKFELKTN